VDIIHDSLPLGQYNHLPATDTLFCLAFPAAIIVDSGPGVWKEEDMMKASARCALSRLALVTILLPVMLALVHARPVQGA